MPARPVQPATGTAPVPLPPCAPAPCASEPGRAGERAAHRCRRPARHHLRPHGHGHACRAGRGLRAAGRRHALLPGLVGSVGHDDGDAGAVLGRRSRADLGLRVRPDARAGRRRAQAPEHRHHVLGRRRAGRAGASEHAPALRGIAGLAVVRDAGHGCDGGLRAAPRSGAGHRQHLGLGLYLSSADAGRTGVGDRRHQVRGRPLRPDAGRGGDQR